MSVYNPSANFNNLSHLSDKILSHVPHSVGASSVRNALQSFLITFTEANYVQMVIALNSARNELAVDEDSKLRILVSIDDGTVAYDSSRTNNNFSSFNSNSINSSNHNTRPEILLALLGQDGVGLSERFSKSVITFQKYRALRLGSTAQSNLGTFRVSMDTTVAV